MQPAIAAIILAAGKGTRMKSDLPKVLHLLAGRALLDYPLTLIRKLKIRPAILVVPKNHAPIRTYFQNRQMNGIKLAIQDPPLGTGHAVMTALKDGKPMSSHYLILSGDVPLISRKTIQKMIAQHQSTNASLTFVTAIVDAPGNYGRVVRTPEEKVTGIVETKDATVEENKIKEINLGIYLIESGFLYWALNQLRAENAQKEYYLTDLIELAVGSGKKIETLNASYPGEGLGINTREELMNMEKMVMAHRVAKLEKSGVRFINPESIYIDEHVVIGVKTTVYGPNYLLGKTRIGIGCTIKAYCHIEDSVIGDKAQIGPYAHLRPGTIIGKEAKIGNFVEIKKSKIGAGSKANHLSYIGDAVIGKKVNIGAGTITCNYDGKKKSRTLIGDGVFVGSDTQFVAPVKIGKGAYIGSGSTITKNVKPRSLALSRAAQTEIKNWAKKK